MKIPEWLGPNDSGLCECGCGEKTPPALYTSIRDNTVKGSPVRFITGHGTRSRLPVREQFEEHVHTEPNSGCHLFVGKEVKGYGRFRVGGKLYLATHVALVLAGREIPPGLCVLHKCDTPPCVNPDHLFLGTRADNAKDRAKKDRTRRGAFPRGVFWIPRGRKHYRAAVYLPQNGGRRYLGDYATVEEAAAVAATAREEAYRNV